MSFSKIAIILSLLSFQTYAGEILGDERKNIDGSVTVFQPRIVYGRGEYQIGYLTNGFKGICSQKGFDSFFPVFTESEAVAEANRLVHITEFGEFSTFIKTSYKAIKKVVCYNKRELKKALQVDMVEKNRDGSYSLINPRLLRGGETLPFQKYRSEESLCRLFGFREAIVNEDSFFNDIRDFAKVVQLKLDSIEFGRILNNTQGVHTMTCTFPRKSYARTERAPLLIISDYNMVEEKTLHMLRKIGFQLSYLE